MTTSQQEFKGLVLEVVRGLQSQLDRLTNDVHGGDQPGLKQVSIETRERLNALASLTEASKKVQDSHEHRLDTGDRALDELRMRLAALELENARDDKTRDKRIDWMFELFKGLLLIVCGILMGKWMA